MDKREKHWFLPTAHSGASRDEPAVVAEPELRDAAPCPCCGCLTIPNHGDALAYICPVCFWEIDLFIHSDCEPSDQNHGMTLADARRNYAAFGATLPRLRRYCRPPRQGELPQAAKRKT